MKKMVLIIFSLYLLLPVFVYELKNVSKVHVMKFTGSFDVVYTDIKQFSEDLTLIESLISSSSNIYQEIFNLNQKINSFQEIYFSNISFLISLSRAPPFFVV